MKKKRIEVKESNKYMSGFIQENSVQDTSISFINKRNKLYIF